MLAAAEKVDKNFLKNAVFAIHATLSAVPFWFFVNLSAEPTFAESHGGLSWFIQHGSQPQWADRFLILAVLGGAGLVSPNRWVRLGSAGALGVGHSMVAVGIFLSNAAAFGVGTYSILALLAIWRIWLEK